MRCTVWLHFRLQNWLRRTIHLHLLHICWRMMSPALHCTLLHHRQRSMILHRRHILQKMQLNMMRNSQSILLNLLGLVNYLQQAQLS